MRTDTHLDRLVRTFADRWQHLGEEGSDRLVADPVLVLGPQGTTPVPRAHFLAAVAARSDAVSSASTRTALADTVARELGDRMVVATISWTFEHGGSTVSLVSDFLLERDQAGLRCVAYLPRTNVLDHLPTQTA